MKSRIAFLSLVFLIGIVLRVKNALFWSFAFTFDVGRDLLAVRDIVGGGKMTLLGPTSAVQGLFYTSWWYYFLAFPFLVFSGDPSGILLFISLLGGLMVLPSFILGRMVGDQKLGLVFASLVAVSPYLVGTSTQIWNPNLVPPFCLVALFFYLLVFRRGGAWSSLFFGFFLGLILEHEIGFGALFIVASGLALVYQRKRIRNFRTIFLLLLFGIFLVEVPRLLFELRHDFLMTRAVLTFLKSGGSGEIGFFSYRFRDCFALFREVWKWAVAGGNETISFFLALLSLLAGLSLLRSSSRFTHLAILCFFSAPVFFFGSLFYPGALWGHHLVGLGLIFVLFVSLVLAWLIQVFGKKMAVLPLLIFLINLSPSRALRDLDSSKWEGDAAVFRNQIAAVDFVYQKAGGSRFNFVAYTPPLIDHTWQYLFSWYGQKKYGYQPAKTTQKLFFLILEPDYQFPGRRQAWLDQREGDGKIVGKKLGKGKIEIEVRER